MNYRSTKYILQILLINFVLIMLLSYHHYEDYALLKIVIKYGIEYNNKIYYIKNTKQTKQKQNKYN